MFAALVDTFTWMFLKGVTSTEEQITWSWSQRDSIKLITSGDVSRTGTSGRGHRTDTSGRGDVVAHLVRRGVEDLSLMLVLELELVAELKLCGTTVF